ncbi:hypothetical protein U9M48_035741 [Paspalum notatum var. saurae]|uniref:Uncharacterized protein n=1 Tax=Paspalum notatum var. saurae TaxID=547442 RepID=A0AAQ3X8Q6_PASNO
MDKLSGYGPLTPRARSYQHGRNQVLKKTDDRLYPEQEDGGSPIKSVPRFKGLPGAKPHNPAN